ncbi:MAG: hypothetical protein HDS59_00265 [Barnesiella sp.]|nr:hypothetical protein [Barnesiella sp.]
MPKPTDYDKTHLRNLSAIATRIDRIFKKAAEEAAKIGVSLKNPLPEDRIFSFDDYPATQKQIERLMSALKDSMETTIVNGVQSAWTLSNNKNNALVSRILGDRAKDLSKEQYRRYFSTNGAALDAFLQRKTQGLNLSDKVWKYTNAFKKEIELGLDLGIRTGESAASMTRSLRQYLQYPDKLFRRVRDEHGNLKLSQAAKDFHPGRGVYRSSYKNALRLAGTETNIAYRTSDHLRWQQLDFVVGIEVRLSNNHTLNGHPFHDICDTLAGRYPKDFKFTGWHPQCRCHAIPILKTEEEMAQDTQRILAGEQPTNDSVNAVKNVPPQFSEWIEDNADRIQRAKERATLPYFIRDNRYYVGGKSISYEDKANAARIETNRKEFERLKADPNYKSVEFNPENGGLKAIHIRHIIHSSAKEYTFFGEERLTSTALELECQQELFKRGRKCLLLEEGVKRSNGDILPALDANIDGSVMDIRSITVCKEHYGAALMAKIKQLNRFNSAYKESIDTICLYFHNAEMYSTGCVEKGIEWIRNKIGKEKIKALKQILIVRKDIDEILLIKCAASE